MTVPEVIGREGEFGGARVFGRVGAFGRPYTSLPPSLPLSTCNTSLHPLYSSPTRYRFVTAQLGPLYPRHPPHSQCSQYIQHSHLGQARSYSNPIIQLGNGTSLPPSQPSSQPASQPVSQPDSQSVSQPVSQLAS